MRRAAIALPLLLAGLPLAGCGAATLSASDLRAQATRICTRANAATRRIPAPSDPDHAERFLREGVAALRPAAQALRRLQPPAELKESYAQAVTLNAQAVALVERRERAIARGEDAPTAFSDLQAALDPITRIEDATWQALQIPACVTR